MQTVRVAWVAAEIEAAGHQWHAPRELALARDRWGVQVNNERGGQDRRLPDLMYWPVPSALPVAVVVEHGLPKPRRERAALEGWKGSIAAGQYAQVRYVTDPSSARRLEDGAARIGRNPRPWTPGGRRQRRRLWRPPKRLPNARSSSGNCSVKKNSLTGGAGDAKSVERPAGPSVQRAHVRIDSGRVTCDDAAERRGVSSGGRAMVVERSTYETVRSAIRALIKAVGSDAEMDVAARQGSLLLDHSVAIIDRD